MPDIQRLVEETALALDRDFRDECEKHVRRCVCEREFCDRFDDCDIAQHELRTLRLAVWSRYAKMN